MKRALSILLAALVISQMMVNVGIGVYYHLNKDYIIKQLCINKRNPAIHCQGHCYLNNQLKKAEQREKQTTLSLKERNEILLNDNFGISVIYFPSYNFINFPDCNTAKTCADNNRPLIKPPSV